MSSRSVRFARVGVALLALGAVEALAAPAHAAGSTGHVSVIAGTKIYYSAGGGRRNWVTVTQSGHTVTVDDIVPLTAGTGCKAVKGDNTKITCTTGKAPNWLTVYLRDGNDTLVNKTSLPMYADGDTGDDVILGGPRPDTLHGASGNDRIYGYGGNDTLDGSVGNDLLSGGDGNDTLRGWWGNDTLYGGSGDDDLDGFDGNDRLYGNDGSDLLRGYQGADYLEGDNGDDIMEGDDPRDGAVSADVMRGGAGRDTVSYAEYTKPVTVDLDGASGDDGQAGEHDTVGADVEDLVGGAGADHLTGNNANNQLFAGGGVDVVHGGGGNDTIYGDAGADWLYGDAGDDSLDGFEDHPYADHIDGGTNTTTGDECLAGASDVLLNCER